MKDLFKPLNDAEMDELSEILDSAPEAMNLEMMDGFFAALICSPEMLMPSSFLPFVLGEEYEPETLDEAEKSSCFILRHWNSVVSQLKDEDVFFPVIFEEDGVISANDWAVGFMTGLELGGDGWGILFNDDEHAGTLIPILALYHEDDPDPEMRTEDIDDEQREKLIAGIAVGVPAIYKYFEPYRTMGLSGNSYGATYKRTSRKIGRNEPCPCGSGKKYKKCCRRN